MTSAFDSVHWYTIVAGCQMLQTSALIESLVFHCHKRKQVSTTA